MLLFCSACSDSDIEPNPSRQAKRHVTLTFSPVQISTRTSADETRIDDINLYLFPTSGDTARHLYLSSQRSVVLELPEGDYALYAVANAGADMGGQTQEYVRSLRFDRDPDALADGPLPMSAEQTVSVRGDMHINVTLVRAVAKIDFSCTVAAEFAPKLQIKSVRICNAPCSMSLFAPSHATTSGDVADTTPDAATGQTFSASYYLLENRQGTVAGIGAQEGKNQTVAPEFATYIYIEGEADGVKVAYRIYPGENNTTDFNIVRNRVYNIDARILGMNTVDWRVSTAEVVVTPLAEHYAPGASAAATLELVSTNDADNEFYLTYLLDAGQGTVAIDGERRTAGTPYPLLSGSGTATAEIVYTQDTPGDVRLRLVVTDRYGFGMERELTTVYKNPELNVTFTQEGYELAAMDRAYVTFTVTQPGYTGRYKAHLSGEGLTFFQGHYSADIPTTELTLYEGNGTYELRLKPEAVGEIPFTVTITDEQGNSTSFESSVKGIKTVANFTLDFTRSAGALYITMESSYPVSEDLTLTVTATVKIVYSGGYTTTRDYTFDVAFEAERSRGTGYVYLDLQGLYDISIEKYTMTSDTPVSRNGMVEYKLQ